MAYKTVKASWLIQKFEIALKEKWRYVAGSAKYGEADCSGIFSYWYAQAGSYMPHGSNSMIRKFSKSYGKVGEIELKPGMAVFRWSNDGNEPDQYKGDGLGNFRHVGLYVGNGRTIEMKDTATGVNEGKISQWHYAAELKNTDYDVSEGGEKEEEKETFPMTKGVVTTSGGTLRLRKSPTTDSTIKANIPNGTELTLTEKKNGWYKTEYNGTSGWVSGDFIRIKEDFSRALTVFVNDENTYRDLVSWLDDYALDWYVQGGDD